MYANDPRLAEHGALSADVVEGAIVGAIRDLLIPGVVAMGIDARPLERWLSCGAPT
jgi:hypothetical protein